MSWASYAPVATASASAPSLRSVSSSAPMSRGRQLEAALDNLSPWYFEYDEPQSGWHTERIHPLPEECSTSEQPQDQTENDPTTSISTSTSLPHTKGSRTTTSRTPPRTPYPSNQDDDELKPPLLVTLKSDDSDAKASLPPRSRDRADDHRSSTSTRGTTIASTASTSANDLVVSGWTIRGSEKKVMYHIDVRGFESQLQTYTIRRSYTDFKHLHSQLSDILEARREHFLLRTKAARHSMQDKESRGTTGYYNGRVSMDNNNTSNATAARYSSNHRSSMEMDVGASAAAAAAASDDLSESWFLSFTLPPLPNAGFLSYWKRHDRSHLQNRCEMFQEILRAANQHPDLRESYAMQVFLKFAPCAIRERGSSYVSLCEYSVPRLDLEEETRERKKLARERRRNSSAHPTMTPE